MKPMGADIRNAAWAPPVSGRESRIISPTAILGYGYPEASLRAGLTRRPTFIAVDGGSTDPGPYYLGSGKSFTSRLAVRRDLELLMLGVSELAIPLIIGSAGGAGGDPHVEWCYEIVASIARQHGLRLKVAIIHAEQDPATLITELREGRIRPLGPVPNLVERDILRSSRIVGQMGIEPIQRALEQGADIVIAGRSCDVSPFAAIPIMQGFDPALAMHAAKILECGAYCAEPAGASDCMFATIYDDSFVLKPLNPERRGTRTSAAAHSLYEQAHPAHIVEPLGLVDVSAASFDELPDGGVRVSGSRFYPAETYTIKLEGAASVGFRAVSIGGIRDETAIKHIDQTFSVARELVAEAFGDPGARHDYKIIFRVYGRNGVMGEHEPSSAIPHEVGVVTEVIAEDPEIASEVCSLVRSTVLHADYPDRLTVGGSLALPFSPHDAPWGEVFEFSAYHLWEVPDPLTPFPIEERAL
jgi:hypothetical protein